MTGVGFTLEFKETTCRHKYFGDLRDGKAHGRGELFLSDGATTVEFVGTFYKGRWWKGKVTYSNHDTCVTVDVENGVFNGGEGTYQVVDIGTNQTVGTGKLKVFNDGNLVYHYKGQFRNGVEDGMGEFTGFKNGNLLYHYKGQFKGGLSYDHMIAWNGGAYTGSLRRGEEMEWQVARLFLAMDRFVYTKKVNVLKSMSLKPRQPVSSFLLCTRRMLCLYTLHLRLTFTLMIIIIHRR